MTQSRDIRVACIGAGYWGKNLVRVFRELGALSLVCDTNQGQLEQVAGDVPSTTSLREALDDPTIDAVCVATPP